MSKEKKTMNQITTNQTVDATKNLDCVYCPLNFFCKRFSLICDLIDHKIFFGAKLLCILMRAEHACLNIFDGCTGEKLKNPCARATTLFTDFLPAINNYLKAFYKYDCDTADDYHKSAVIFALTEKLNEWHLLKDFDSIYNQDLENTYLALKSQFDYEITKSEKQKLANCKA